MPKDERAVNDVKNGKNAEKRWKTRKQPKILQRVCYFECIYLVRGRMEIFLKKFAEAGLKNGRHLGMLPFFKQALITMKSIKGGKPPTAVAVLKTDRTVFKLIDDRNVIKCLSNCYNKQGANLAAAPFEHNNLVIHRFPRELF